MTGAGFIPTKPECNIWFLKFLRSSHRLPTASPSKTCFLWRDSKWQGRPSARPRRLLACGCTITAMVPQGIWHQGGRRGNSRELLNFWWPQGFCVVGHCNERVGNKMERRTTINGKKGRHCISIISFWSIFFVSVLIVVNGYGFFKMSKLIFCFTFVVCFYREKLSQSLFKVRGGHVYDYSITYVGKVLSREAYAALPARCLFCPLIMYRWQSLPKN